jgi:hypothetical protein
MAMRRLKYVDFNDDDRPLRFARLRGKLWVVLVEWTGTCSGCTEYGDYGSLLSGPMGCEECGYTGKRRNSYWVPLDKDEQIVLNTRMKIRKALGKWEATPAATVTDDSNGLDAARKG